MTQKSALIIVANEGAEEMEVVITGDVLVRGGVNVVYAGLTGKEAIKCSRGVHLVPDVALDDVKNQKFDVIILPGGQPGSDLLAANETVGHILKVQQESGGIIAAICAAPIALKTHGIKADLVTSHPCMTKKLQEGGYNYSEERVVVSGNVVTSRGPGTAFEFALKLVSLLVGEEKSNSLIAPMVLKL